jgi:hypothetical protein
MLVAPARLQSLEQYYKPMSSTSIETNNTIAKQAQHPFHVLGSSKLPVFMAAFVGGLAISVIAKLQNIVDLSKFLTIGNDILHPIFVLSNTLPNVEVPDTLVDVRIMQFLTLILITI